MKRIASLALLGLTAVLLAVFKDEAGGPRK